MSEALKNGASAAYPQGVPDDRFHWQHEGLSKRELLAAMAMQGIMANPGGYGQSYVEKQGGIASCVAKDAVEIADALLRKLDEP